MSINFDKKEVFTYIEAWEKAIETRKSLYNQFFGGSLSGISLVVVTIGLNLEKMPLLGWFGKGLLSFALVLFLLALGNIMHGWRFVIDANLLLQEWKRDIVLEACDSVTEDSVKEKDELLRNARDSAHRQYPYAYASMALAVILGVVGFYWIVWKF